MSQIIQIVQAVQAVQKAKRRIPEGQRLGVTYYSELDTWLYHAVMDTRVCELCRKYEDANEWRGDQLRLEFPFHEIIDEDTIDVHVHPNCRCYLTRLLQRDES